MNQLKGRVVSLKASYLIVDIDFNQIKKTIENDLFNGNYRLLCTRRSRLAYDGQYVNVGDKVLVDSIDWKASRGVVIAVEKRINLLARPPVANVTEIVVLVSVEEPSLDFDQTSRFLLTAEKTNVNIILALTKIDLISLDKLRQYSKRLSAWGYIPIPISVESGEGADLLLERLKASQLVVLCGPSGVGKTSLINYLLPSYSLSVKSVSKKLRRGRHTTRNVELFSLQKGVLIADTPGFNRPDLEIMPSELALLFPEIRDNKSNNKSCKFRDCLHRDEPGCVVHKDWERYYFYREMLEELINSHH